MLSKVAIKSKIIWLAIAQFVISLAGGFTNTVIDASTATEIVELDWSNIGMALMAAAYILARAFFTKTVIKGIA